MGIGCNHIDSTESEYHEGNLKKMVFGFFCSILRNSISIISPHNQLHSDAPDLETFSKSSTVLVRDFPDTCSFPANAKGIPYCLMVPGKVTLSNGTVFTVNKDQIDSCVNNIADVVERLVMMEVDG